MHISLRHACMLILTQDLLCYFSNLQSTEAYGHQNNVIRIYTNIYIQWKAIICLQCVSCNKMLSICAICLCI
jgi:hypothetical protein